MNQVLPPGQQWRELDRSTYRRIAQGAGICLFLLVLIGISEGVVRPILQLNALKTERRQLEQDLRQAYAEQQRLLIESRILNSRSGLTIEARKLGFGYPGERRILFETEEGE